MGFNLDNYEQVDSRLKRFFEDYKKSKISVITEIVETPTCLKGITFKATIRVSDLESGEVFLEATGFANEIPGEGMINKDAPLENCETSAIGRALANLNYSGSKRPSAEEMNKVGRDSYAPPYKAAPLPIKPPEKVAIPAVKPTASPYAETVGTNSGYLIGFGKYKGRSFGSIGPAALAGYVKWIKGGDDWQKKPSTKDLVEKAEVYLKSLSGN